MKRRTILTATVIRAEEQSSKITNILTFPSTLSLTRIQRLLVVDGGFVMRMMIRCISILCRGSTLHYQSNIIMSLFPVCDSARHQENRWK